MPPPPTQAARADATGPASPSAAAEGYPQPNPDPCGYHAGAGGTHALAERTRQCGDHSGVHLNSTSRYKRAQLPRWPITARPVPDTYGQDQTASFGSSYTPQGGRASPAGRSVHPLNLCAPCCEAHRRHRQSIFITYKCKILPRARAKLINKVGGVVTTARPHQIILSGAASPQSSAALRTLSLFITVL